MTRIGLVCALISAGPLSACGDTTDRADLGIVGAWALERDGCVYAVRFRANGEFETADACELESGEIGVERYEGVYLAEGDTLEAYYERGTCPGDAFTTRATWQVRGDQLVLDSADGRLLLERVESDGMGNGVLRNGCWDGDSIVFMSLRPLD